MNTVGTVAAATLGFIAADTPGALIAARLFNGRNAGNNLPMARSSLKRKRSSGSSTKTNTKRRTITKRKKLTKKRPSKARRSRRQKKRDSPLLQLANEMRMVRWTMPGPKSQKHDWGGRLKFKDTFTAIIKGSLGLQTVYDGRYFHHNQQLTGPDVPDATIRNDRSQSATNPFDLNPNKATTGGGEIPATINPTHDVIYCSYQKTEMTLTNLQNISQTVDIYWFLCKNDNSKEPSACWQLDVDHKAFGQPLNVQPTNAATTPVAGTPNINTYGEYPGKNATAGPTLHKNWSIVEHKSFILGVGQTIKYEFTRPIHKKLQHNTYTGTENHYKGLTFVPMFIIKPQPILVRIASEAATTQIMNTGPTLIGYMQTDTAFYHVQKQKTHAVDRVYLGNFQALPANAVAEVMEVDGDAQQLRQLDMNATYVGPNPG